MLIGVAGFDEPWVNIVSITFSALILCELLNIYSEVKNAFENVFLRVSLTR